MSSQSSTAIEDIYRDSVKDNLQKLLDFPICFQNALTLSETNSVGEDVSGGIKLKATVEECLNGLSKLTRLSGDLELISISSKKALYFSVLSRHTSEYTFIH